METTLVSLLRPSHGLQLKLRREEILRHYESAGNLGLVGHPSLQ